MGVVRMWFEMWVRRGSGGGGVDVDVVLDVVRMWCWMCGFFFFARPTLSVRSENSLVAAIARCRSLGRCPGFSCGSHTPNRLLGYRDGARVFRADHLKPRRFASSGSLRMILSTRTLLVRLVWLQELSKVSALGCLHRTQFTQSFSACSQCPQRRWLSPSSQELLANSRFDGHNFAWRGVQHVQRTPVEDDSRLPVVVLRAAAILPAPTRCGAPARSRTRRGGTQRALSPYTSCVQAYAAFAAGHPKTTRFHVARGSTLVLSQEPRPKQGMAARHP